MRAKKPETTAAPAERQRDVRAVARTQADPRQQMTVTEERKRVFLKALAETGSPYAAARAASPPSKDGRPRCTYNSFNDLARRDPIFAAAWDEAASSFLGVMESAIAERALNPTRRPIVQNGEVVAEELIYDNKLLLAMAERVHPDRWAKREKVEVSGSVQHTHRHTHVGIGLTLSLDDLYLLPDDRREQLIDLMSEVADARERLEAQTARPVAVPALSDERPFAAVPAEVEAGNG